MAYENLQLVVAALSGEVYLARQLKSGFMSDSRRIITEDCLRASAEWFMKNKKVMIQYASDREGESPSLFYTSNPDKASRIKAILEEDEEDLL